MDKAHQKQMNQRKHQRYRKQPPGMYPPFQQAVASKYCHIVHKQIFKQEHICIKYIDLVSPFLSRLFRIFTVIIKQYNFTFLSKQVLQIPQIIPYFDKRCSFLYLKEIYVFSLQTHKSLFRCINCCSSPRTLQAYLLLCFLIFYLRYYFLEFLRKSGILISIGCTVLSG